MTASGPFGLLPLLPALISAIGGLASRFFSDPRDSYREKISDIQEDRLGDVTDALGPIVSDAYLFMRDGDSNEPKELEAENRASVAVTNSIDESEDLSPVKGAINRYFYPVKAFRRCRLLYDFTGYSFIIAVVAGVLSPAIEILDTNDVIPPLALFVIVLIAFLSMFIGMVSFGCQRYYAKKLDEMSETSEFTLGD